MIQPMSHCAQQGFGELIAGIFFSKLVEGAQIC